MHYNTTGHSQGFGASSFSACLWVGFLEASQSPLLHLDTFSDCTVSTARQSVSYVRDQLLPLVVLMSKLLKLLLLLQ
jgi:hypothetical protein